MSEGSKIVEAWRKTKLREGYGRLDVWIPLDTIARFKLLASRRRQTLADCLTDAAVALEGLRGGGRTIVMTVGEQERREAAMEARLLAKMTGKEPAPLPSATEAVHLNEHGRPLPKGIQMADATLPIPGGMKVCPKTKHWMPHDEKRCRGCKQESDAASSASRKRRERAMKEGE